MGSPGSLRRFAAFLLLLAGTLQAGDPTPPGFTVAFYGDQGVGPGSVAVLNLVKREGAHAAVHLGDFDYLNNPAAWERQTDSILGSDFPLIALAGNHDLPAWFGLGGYAERIQARFRRMGVEPKGEAGVQCSFRYKGIFFVLTAPGLMRSGHGDFIRRELAGDTSIWRISAWHVNQHIMQPGSKPDEAGWDVYEESLAGGAIIATAHEHSYARTHLLSGMRAPVVASRDSVLRISRGRTFAFVSGLGGSEARPQYRGGDWWARVYTASQQAMPGALFGAFNVDGDPRKAVFTFKAVDGSVVDRFTVFSESEKPRNPEVRIPPARPWTLEINPEALGIPPGGRLRIDDLNGRAAARIDDLRGPVSLKLDRSGLLFIRGGSERLYRLRTLVILP